MSFTIDFDTKYAESIEAGSIFFMGTNLLVSTVVAMGFEKYDCF